MERTVPEFNHNQPIYSISEISQAVKRVLEDHFGVVRLRGEISGFKGAHSSGHCYFSLKDDNSVIGAVCWKGTVSRLTQKPEEGLEVIATGRLSAYGGKYQLVVDHMEAAGQGALMALLAKRRKMFEAEGLFDPKRKKPLPYLPQTIGIITSPTGAVIRDILHRISERFPVHVLVWPVAVQGEGAAQQIAAAISGFDSLAQKPDMLIVARGGGSIEDLWAFNEEIVVRAAAACSIPLISAVGHETDTTLIDFISDQRAPTPTAAAEMAVPVREELRQGVHQLEKRLHTVAARMFENATQRVDDWSERLVKALPAMLERKSQMLAVFAAKLQPRVLFSEIKASQDRLVESGKRMGRCLQNLIEKYEQKLVHMHAMLESVNYKRVLERGFVLVKSAQGKVVAFSKDAAKEKELELVFKDGALRVKPTP